MPRGSLAMGTGRSLGAHDTPDFQGLGGLHQGKTERSGKCDRCHVVAWRGGPRHFRDTSWGHLRNNGEKRPC